MQESDWELIEAGDLLEHLPAPTKEKPTPTPARFQVFKLDQGKVYAVRMIDQHTDEGVSFTTTETAVIEKHTSNWKLVRMKQKVVATGGFTVTRAADNHANPEYQRCPSAADKSMTTPQTLENK
jgi:hypothetical protein